MNVTYRITREDLKEKDYKAASVVKQESVTMKNLNVLVAKVLIQFLKKKS